jgi:hypothetical protein
MERTHFGQHGDDCFGCKVQSIEFGNVEPPAERAIEKRMDKDLPAYQRMRYQGLQPPRTKGAAELEARAHSQIEIDLGKLIEPKLLKRSQGAIDDGMAIAKQINSDMALTDPDKGLAMVKDWRARNKAGAA